MNDAPTHIKQSSPLFAWLRLLRISALPSAISNILMAFLLVHGSWTPAVELVLLVLSSSSLYLAGMVLNDFFDYSIDLQQRPHRPLPAKQISRSTASLAGIGLLLAGVVFAGGAGWINGHELPISLSHPMVRSGAIAFLLAVCIVLYDGPLKRTIVAPCLMGCCRTLNVLLGASTFLPYARLDATENTSYVLGMPAVVWWIALSLGILITGATLLGRKEAVDQQSRGPLAIAGLLIAIGLAGLATVVYCPTDFEISAQVKKVFPLFIGVVSLTIIRRVVEAIATAKPKSIQAGVISVLRSLIILDAALCYLVVPHHLVYAFCVVALLIPTLLLGRWVSST